MERTFPRAEALRFGWETAKKNVRFFIVVLLILAGVSFVFSAIDNSLTQDQVFLRFIIGIANWVISSITGVGLVRIALNFVEKKESKYVDLFNHYDRTVNYMAASILYGLIVAVGIVLLIVPGIIWGIKFQFFTYFVVEKNMGPVQALKASWEMTKGIKWQLFVYGLITIGINILGALALFIGLLWTIPTTLLATAYLYKHLSKK